MKKYRNVFHLGVLLLSLCCLLLSMISCSGDGQSAENTTVSEPDEEYTSEHQDTEQGVMIAETPLSDYTIVYETERDGYAEIAERLRDMISNSFSINLPLYADNDHEEVGAEILIGKTNRSLSTSVYTEKSPQLMTYEVIVRQNKLQIVCGGPYSARQCVDSLRSSLSSLEKEGEYFATDLAPDTAELAADANLRVMTSNVLAARWGEDSNSAVARLIPPVSQRVEIFAALLADYQPDVIGMQEGDQKWIDQLPVYLEILKRDYGIEYTWVFPTYEGVQNLTSILYRSDKYDLVTSDVQVNSYWDVSQKNYHLRLYAWVKLQEKAVSAKEFIVLNTHWAWESADWVEKSVSEEIELVNSLRSQYGVPVFCTGDFNSNQYSADYSRFVSKAGVADLCPQAENIGALINECGGCGSIGSPRTDKSYIDHIFGVGSYTSLRYETIVGNEIQWLSDHAPHIADIKLN